MTEIKGYKIDIVKRTKEILNDFYPTFDENDREGTFLMNCLLGLIIAITESEKKSPKLFRGIIDEQFIKHIPNRIGFIQSKNIEDDLTNHDLTEIDLNVSHRNDLIGKDKLWLISKLRNCIAHQNIKGINENEKWVGVRLWNMNNNQKDFEIIFKISELKMFSVELAEKFIEAYR